MLMMFRGDVVVDILYVVGSTGSDKQWVRAKEEGGREGGREGCRSGKGSYIYYEVYQL